LRKDGPSVRPDTEINWLTVHLFRHKLMLGRMMANLGEQLPRHPSDGKTAAILRAPPPRAAGEVAEDRYRPDSSLRGVQ